MSGGPASAALLPARAVLARPGAPSPWRGDALLFAGALLVLLAWFVGPFGVYDLYEYAQDAEALWLGGRWDLRLEHPGQHGEAFSRFSIGLPILSGPFVLLGAGLERLSGGAFSHRWLMALMAPLATAGAAVAIAGIARAAGLPRAAGVWGGVVFVLSSAALYYSRFYFVEPVEGFLALLGVWAFLAASAAPAAARWAGAAGLAFGMATMCHYTFAPAMGAMTVGGAWVLWRRGGRGRRAAWALLVMAALPVAAVLAMNWHRFGNPLVTGYTYYDDGTTNTLALSSLPRNLRGLGIVLLSVPWLVVVVAMLGAARRLPAGPWRGLAGMVLAALVAQECLWLAFKCTWWSPLRYHVALIMLAGAGLPALAVALERRWPRRGLPYATIVALLAGFFGLIVNRDYNRPLLNDPDDAMHPGQATIATWYAAPGPYHRAIGEYTFSATGSDDTFYYPLVPLGAREAVIMGALLAAGGILLHRAWRGARSAEGRPTPVEASARPPTGPG